MLFHAWFFYYLIYYHTTLQIIKEETPDPSTAGAILPDSLQTNHGRRPLGPFLKAKGPLFDPDLAMDI